MSPVQLVRDRLALSDPYIVSRRVSLRICHSIVLSLSVRIFKMLLLRQRLTAWLTVQVIMCR